MKLDSPELHMYTINNEQQCHFIIGRNTTGSRHGGRLGGRGSYQWTGVCEVGQGDKGKLQDRGSREI